MSNDKQPTANREASFFRPLAAADGKTIAQINLYDASGVWYTSNSGWLEHHIEGRRMTHDVWAIYAGEARNARKVDTGRDYPYVLPIKKHGERAYALYIPVPRVDGVTVETLRTNTYYTTAERYTVPMAADVQLPEMVDGKLVYRIHRVDSITIDGPCTMHKTDLGEQADALAAEMEKIGVKVAAHDAAKILSAYKVEKR